MLLENAVLCWILNPGPWCLPCVSCLGFFFRTFFFIPNIQKFTVVCFGVVCFSFIVLCTWWAISTWKLMAFSSGKVSYIIWFFTSICLLGVLSGTSISQRSDLLNWSSTFKNLFISYFPVVFVVVIFLLKIFSILPSFFLLIFYFAFIFLILMKSFLFSESFFPFF